jgi:hypothetical protein
MFAFLSENYYLQNLCFKDKKGSRLFIYCLFQKGSFLRHLIKLSLFYLKVFILLNNRFECGNFKAILLIDKPIYGNYLSNKKGRQVLHVCNDT